MNREELCVLVWGLTLICKAYWKKYQPLPQPYQFISNSQTRAIFKIVPPVYFQIFLWLRHQSAMVHTPSRIDLTNENVFIKSFISLKTKQFQFRDYIGVNANMKKRRSFWVSFSTCTSSAMKRIWNMNLNYKLEIFDSIG